MAVVAKHQQEQNAKSFSLNVLRPSFIAVRRWFQGYDSKRVEPKGFCVVKKFIVKKKNASGITSKTFIVDDGDAWLFRSYVWHLCANSANNYYLKRKIFTAGGGKYAIWEKITDILIDSNGGKVSHKNGNYLDLRRDNLCIANQAEIARQSMVLPNKIMQLAGVRKIGEKKP